MRRVVRDECKQENGVRWAESDECSPNQYFEPVLYEFPGITTSMSQKASKMKLGQIARKRG